MISENKKRALDERMQKLGILESDLDEHFIRSGGAGGQNVNKVNTCVWLKHIPSSIEVKCQITRSQADNRYFAREILCDKIEQKALGAQSAIERERYRIRKQKKRRSKKAKEKMLEKKRQRSETKKSRSPVKFE